MSDLSEHLGLTVKRAAGMFPGIRGRGDAAAETFPDSLGVWLLVLNCVGWGALIVAVWMWL
jgi:hypothetical protein